MAIAPNTITVARRAAPIMHSTNHCNLNTPRRRDQHNELQINFRRIEIMLNVTGSSEVAQTNGIP